MEKYNKPVISQIYMDNHQLKCPYCLDELILPAYMLHDQKIRLSVVFQTMTGIEYKTVKCKNLDCRMMVELELDYWD